MNTWRNCNFPLRVVAVLLLGPDCGDVPTAPAAGMRNTCSWNVTIDPVFMGSMEQFAWVSPHVVVATVAERLPPVWGPDWRADSDQQAVYTDTRLATDQLVRGTLLTTFLSRQPGGAIGSCTQHVGPTISFVPGDRYLLFLRRTSMTGGLSAIYSLSGGKQGAWRLDADDEVQAPNPNFQQYDGKPVSEVLDAIRAVLGAPVTTSRGRTTQWCRSMRRRSCRRLAHRRALRHKRRLGRTLALRCETRTGGSR